MLALTVDDNGELFRADDRGLPARTVKGPPQLSGEKPVIILVNGFNFDPTEDGKDNPHQTLFAQKWRPMLEMIPEVARGDWDVVSFGWYSAELELPSWIRAWVYGRRNPYRWGWDLALRAAGTLAHVIGWDEGLERTTRPRPTLAEVTLIAHSLGSRVVLAALRQLQPLRVRRVLLLNGAEYSQTARVTAAYTHAQVLNIVVQSDEVLKTFGRTFAPERFIDNVVGRDGIIGPPPHWADVQLDSPAVQAKAAAAGWPDLQGNRSGARLNHWHSYEHAPNWALYNSFLGGTVDAADLNRILNA
jgi:hypothetical protein